MVEGDREIERQDRRDEEVQGFSGGAFTPQERQIIRRLIDRADTLERLSDVASAKKIIWDFVLKLSGAVTVVAGAAWAFTQFWRGNGQ